MIGKNKISETPNTIALFFNLPDPQKYTGHSFRRSGATILPNSGANLVAVKSLGGWKSDSIAQGYIDNSLKTKRNIFDDITGSVISNTATASTSKTSKSAFDKPSYSTVQQVPGTSKENTSPIQREPIHSSDSHNGTHVQPNINQNFDKPSEDHEMQHEFNQNDAYIDNIDEDNSNHVLPKRQKLTKKSTNLY